VELGSISVFEQPGETQGKKNSTNESGEHCQLRPLSHTEGHLLAERMKDTFFFPEESLAQLSKRLKF
jgi:hypothetical protein